MITLINALMPFDAICLIGSNAGGLDWGLQEEDMKFIEQPERLEKEMEAHVLRRLRRPSSLMKVAGRALSRLHLVQKMKARMPCL